MALTARRKVSAKNRSANRHNGARSTGPRSAAGKARSATAGLRHGYYSKSAAVALTALGEDPADFKRRCDSLIDTYQPTDALQMSLVFRMARSAWRMERFDRVAESMAVNHLAKAEEARKQVEALKLMPVFGKLERLEALTYGLARDPVVGPDQLKLFEQIQHDLPPEKAKEVLRILLRLREPGTPVEAGPLAELLAENDEILAAEGEDRIAAGRELVGLLGPEIDRLHNLIIEAPDIAQARFARDELLAASEPKTEHLKRGEGANLRQLRETVNLFMKLKRWSIVDENEKK